MLQNEMWPIQKLKVKQIFDFQKTSIYFFI